LEIDVSVLVDPEVCGNVDQARLNEVMRQILSREGMDKPLTVGLLITTGENIRRLNLTYRGQDRETDVLAFRMQDDDDRFVSAPSRHMHLGDVVVSYPHAVTQAEQYGHPLEEELDRLVVHGALHLVGYTDQTDEARHTMWQRQEALLREVRGIQSRSANNMWEQSFSAYFRHSPRLEVTMGIGRRGLVDSFRHAFAGLWHPLRTQRNARIHVAIAILVIIAGVVLDLQPMEWAIIGLTIAFVLVAETFNTVVEVIVDLVTEEYHPLAKQAKDMAAGAVLAAAVAAVAVGVLVLGPPLLTLLGWGPWDEATMMWLL
jgi:undecaprenol kinase